ncbi:ead/Ea22-like family protein [Salmonella enterica subsp. enterica]|nr:ead/Ea22-like family protein [Salmonella enterica subsp. enterica serovar Abony]
MSNIDKRALREVAEKATKGEWWSDVVDTDGEYGEGEDRVSGYHSYAVYVGHESLLDMINSTAACIHTEWDHDYHMAWDETAKRNAEFIAAANPDTVLALLDELETKEEQRANWFRMAQKLGEDLDTAERLIAELDQRLIEYTGIATREARRVAELEARKVNLSKLSVGEVMHMSGFSRDYAEGWCAGNDNAIHEIRTAGIKVKES